MENLQRFTQLMIELGAFLQELSTERTQARLDFALKNLLPENCSVDKKQLEEWLQEFKEVHTLRVLDIIEFHGRCTVKLSNGQNLTYNDGITHY